eukprot:Plantae.Rhodophyta-Purpureofilum_apyrenoidigerum.ctg10154.p1 GENE.Plantae.Rhodophyta-Purpureofilum_apyrenoidigerum.ctg10154~~Plantae.Rhodophyta-Purpureofilum_apyrenoidigerum.ctg10154.p1  ORF type:complete len:457 (-),score=101.14 Plantae.Rhodophyta-Purpureofilum_apyrenoidigerum.ctg10154:184-1554(-)
MEQKLIYAVLEHLRESPSEEEDLNVAAERLASAYGVDLQSEEQRKELSIRPKTLVEVFEAGLKSLGLDGVGSAAPAAAGGTTAKDPSYSAAYGTAFEKFLGSLKRTKFFEGVPEGSPEYQKRIEKAKAKFDEKYSKAKEQYTGSGPTTAASKPAAAFAAPAKSAEPETVSRKAPIDEDIDVERAEALKKEGNDLMNAGNYEQALQQYSEAIKVYDTNAVYWCNRAAAKIHLAQYTSAIEDCNMAIALDPQYVRARERLATVYRHLSMKEEQEAVLKEALEVDPNNEKIKAELSFLQSEGQAGTRAAPTGMPSIPGMSGGMPAGMPDLSSLLNNPQIASLANQVMSNPAMMQQAMSMFGGGMPGANAPASDTPVSTNAAEGSAPPADMMRDLQEGRLPAGLESAVQSNPQLASLAEDIRRDPNAAIMRAMNDPQMMSSIMNVAGSLFGGAPQPPPQN